jgi:hypothetical protein
VKLLLHRGAHVNAKDGSGFRTLKIAINRGHSNVVQLQKLYGAKEQSRIADANFQREERMRGQAYILAALLIFLMSPVRFVEQTGADESTEKEQVAKKVTALIELIRDAKAEEFQEARCIHMYRTAHGTTVAVAIFTVEGFWGGNNYTQYMAVFANLAEVVESRTPKLLSLRDFAAIGGGGWRNIDPKNVAITSQGEAITINLSTKEYGPDDPGCCPSKKSNSVYLIDIRQGWKSSRLVIVD